MQRIKGFALLFVLIVLGAIMIPSAVRAAATLRANQPLYTRRDKQFTLLGSGYTLN